MKLMDDEFWKRGDKVVHDGQRADIIGKRMFGRPIKDAELVTYKDAKRLAMAMLMDLGYREWRSSELDKASAPEDQAVELTGLQPPLAPLLGPKRQ